MKKYYAILITIFSFLNATQINVDGNAYLESQQDHSSIKVKCTAVSPSAVTDSTITDSDGRYTIALEIGIYNIEYSKENYLPHYVSNLYLTEDATLSDVTLQSGTILDISDTLSGILTADHIYRVTGDLIVPQDSTLTINPGVRIMFAGNYNLNCYGPITAIGTEQDSIYFTSAMSPPAAGDWGGVYVYYNDYDSTNIANQFDYCVFSYGEGNTAQLEISSSLASINHSSFRTSSRGDLYLNYSYGNVNNSNFSGGSNNYWNINNYYSQVVYRNLLLSNFDDSFYIHGSGSNVELTNSTFINGKRRALYTDGWATATIDSCLFSNIENDWTVQFHDNSLIDFQNNVLENIYAWNAIGVWSSAHVNILDNYIEGRLYYTDYDNNSHNQSTPPQIAYNIIEKDPDDCCYEGLDMRYNSRLVEAHHNTIYGFTNGHRGVHLRDNDSLSIHSNIVYGNSNALYSYNNRYMDLSYNSFYANSNLIQDDDFPQGFGDVIATNANGDPADIYSNIFMDPQFTNFVDYELMVSSPAINAGSPDYLDADGTVSDMGAKPFYFPFLIDHTPLSSTTSDTVGPYSVSATITPLLNQSITSTLFYRVTPDGFYADNSNNTALEFDGNSSGDRVEIPHNSNYYFGNSISVEAWIKPNSTGNSYIFSNRANNGNEGFLLTYDSWDRRIRWHIWTNTGSSSWDGNTQLNVGQWYHISATYDGNDAKLYINGALDGNWNWQNSGTINYSPDGITIGYRRHHGQEFNGSIDEVRIWNTARSSNDILSNMSRELFGTETGLVGYWRFNEEPSSSAIDYSNNQNNGNIINASYTDYTPNLLQAEGFLESEWTTIAMSNTTGNNYSGDIPGQSLFSRVDYFVEITDGSDTLTSPYYVPYEYHRFNVSLFESLVDFNAVSQNDGSVALSWGTPVPIGSTLLGYNLYYDTDPEVEITTEKQLATFFSGGNSYTHNDLEEGTEYYYKVTGVFDDGNSSELMITDEISAISDNSMIVAAYGMVQVEDATDHSSVKIVFHPESSSGIKDSVLTNSTGFFNIILPISIYSVDITKEGCVPVHLSSVFLSNNYDFGTIQLIARDIQEISGSISGTLASNKYYLVTGNLSVSSNDTLWIEPGVIIAFDGYYRIDAQGPIFATGTEEDSILFTSHSSQPGSGDWEYIHLNSNAKGSRFDYCVFENGDGWSEWVASGVVRINHVSDIQFDHCRFSHNRRGAIAIYGGNNRNYKVQNSTFSYNYQDQNQDGGALNIRLWSSSGDVLISNNIFYQNYGRDIAAYDCVGLIISNNSFYSDHNNYDNQSLYMRQIKPLIITDNIFEGKSYIGIHHDCFGLIKNNFIQHNTHYTNGIYVSQSTMEIVSNEIVNCRDGIYYQNSRNFTENDSYDYKISYNTIYDTYENSLEIRDNSHDIEISNNTLVNADMDNNNGSGGAAVYFENNSGDIFTHSNVITDSRYASYINNNTGSIDFNNNAFWNNDNLFSGSGYPTDMGTVNSQNVNGDPSDIYSNIYLDPQFVEADNNNYSLLGTSPLIDAGYILYTDPDGSILDMGAHYYDHGNPHNLALIDGDDQEITLSWSAVNRDSLTGYNVYSKLTTETDYTFSLLTTDTTASVSSLTNNLDYKFVVTSVYPNSESINSVSVTGRPGLAEIAFWPAYLIQSTDSEEDTTVINFQILNNGVKDLFYVLEEDSLDHFLTGYYYNNSDWDNFSELLAVRTDDEINFNWDDVSQLPSGVPDDNFHIRWTGSVNFPVTGDYYFEYCIDDNIRMSVDGNWIIWTGGCCWCGQNQYIEQGVHEVIIDFIEYGGSAYTYLKWQPPGESLEWFGGSGFLTPDMFSNITGTVSPSSSVDIEIAIPPTNVSSVTSMIPYTSNDKSDPYIELPLLLMTDYTFIPALQFFPTEETGDPFYFVMNDGNIDGNDFQAGDEVAIFDGDSCVGAGIFNNNYPFVVKSIGFNESNSYKIKIWDNSQYRYGTGEITELLMGDGSFAANGFNEGSINATVFSTNNIDITANQFSLVSLNMFPQDQDASAVFGNINGLKIVYDDHGGAYIPDYSINTIGSVNLTEGYYLYFDSTNSELSYPGLNIDNSNWPLTIHSNRWNYISYLPEIAADTSIFSEIQDSIDIIQDAYGGSWIPSMDVNTIGNFEPGRGYKIFLSGNTDLNFTYPTVTHAPSKIIANEIPSVKHFEYDRTGLPYAIVIHSTDFEGRRLQNGDEIGIFDGELCVGAGVFTGDWPLSVTAWAGNENVDVQGYTKNKPIALKLYSSKYKTVYSLFVEFRSEEDAQFEGTNYSVIQRASTGGNVLPNTYALGNNYPNPFNPTTIIPYQLPEDARVRIVIYNMLGQEVAILLDEFQLANFHRATWKGKDARGKQVPSGVYIYRLETPEYNKSKKLLLLK